MRPVATAAAAGFGLARSKIPHLLAAWLAFAGPTVRAGELVVDGRVLDVQPIYTTHQVAAPARDCPTSSSPTGNELVALLRWDLQPPCSSAAYRSEAALSGYRVRYEWDGRIYTRVLQEAPGDTVRLRVRVR